jgi:Zn-dependent M16 (insulinase) family peptidase
MLSKRILILTLAFTAALMVSGAMADGMLEKLEKNQKVGDFRTEALYENEIGQVMGARFRHAPTRFVLDFLRIQSVPQAFMWVNTAPVSDQGEPHTLEHLLLGKGTKGRYVASLEDMSLGSSSAFTQRLRTCYHFHTSSGTDVFFNLFEKKLDAMLNPNFSDEEIRREVRNMGIAVDPVDSTLSLEEKGTVYNEMVSSFERTWGNMYHEMGRLLYGMGHAVSYSSGGHPDAIREMVPKDIRDFHHSTHQLNNMGAIAALPDEISLEVSLARFAGILSRLRAGTEPADHPEDHYWTLEDPDPAPMGTIKQVSFPHQNENEPGELIFAWPPVLDLDPREEYLLDLFMENLASGQTSNLYKMFIDSQTRVMDIGATAVYTWRSSYLGLPSFVNMENIRPDAGSLEMMESIRSRILSEIEAIAGYADGSAELTEFNERAMNRILERRRQLRDFLNSPPRFGYRRSGSAWMDHLTHLHKVGGFRRQLALNDELEAAREKISGKKNIWRDYVAKWKLLKNEPYGVVTLPDPDYLKTTESAREERIQDYVADLETRYGVSMEEALRKFRAEYDAKTEEIEKEARTIEIPEFTENPPMTLDDQLDYAIEELAGGGDLLFARFDNITSSTVGLAFDLNVVPQDLYVYLATLPTFMTDVGVVREGTPIPYDEMRELLRKEVLRLDAYFDVNIWTERAELVVRGAGSDLEETRKALGWMGSILFEPDLREENLPRIRDAVDLRLRNLRNRMRGSEESWVTEPAYAYRKQDNPLLLTTDCFLTRTHAYHRLRWQMRKAGEGQLREFNDFMDHVETLPEGTTREDLVGALSSLEESSGESEGTSEIQAKLEGLSPEVRELAKDALEDLRLSLSEIPDANLKGDWEYLCAQMKLDLAVPPEEALGRIHDLLRLIAKQDNVRSFVTSSQSSWDSIRPDLDRLTGRLDALSSEAAQSVRRFVVLERMRERYRELGQPRFVGLVNENTRSGVHINTTSCASFTDSNEETLLRFLAAKLYAGGGAHSIFMKTWGAGLAYSNGLRSSELRGLLIYYAERCPDLAQTMQFVVNELANAHHDSSLADYTIAQTFSFNRAGNRYESRGESMAADLADGLTPDVVRRFRESVLAVRESEGFYDTLRDLMSDTYGEVLPGLGPVAEQSQDAVYYVIGPEKQFESYEEYIRSVEGDVSLYRIYPRDYWLVASLDN